MANARRGTSSGAVPDPSTAWPARPDSRSAYGTQSVSAARRLPSETGPACGQVLVEEPEPLIEIILTDLEGRTVPTFAGSGCAPNTVGVLLAEELLLLGLDPNKGTAAQTGREALVVGLAGALVGELALAGLAELSGRRIIAVHGPAAGRLLNDAHQALAQPKPRPAAKQLLRLDKRVGGIWSRLVDGLIDRSVLGRRCDRVLFITVTRHPVLQPAAREEPLQRVRAAATGEGELEPRAAALLALAAATGLGVVVPDKSDRQHVKHRIQVATELTPIAPVVKKVIAGMRAANVVML